MLKKNKEFNFKLYGISVFVIIAAVLVLITTTTFKSKYTAFNSEKVAENFVSTIVSSGDGYNAYKNTLVSKSSKYGDYIRKYYMYPVIYRDAGYDTQTGTDGLKGYNDSEYIGEKTESDDGTLQGQLIDEMYPVYEELLEEIGWDNYNDMFQEYLKELVSTREEIYGDDYITDDIMFTVLEANVNTYGEKLTGTEDAFDENTDKQTSFKTIGKYESVYGEDYKFTVSAEESDALDLELYKASCDEEALATYGVTTDDISEIKSYTVTVSEGDADAVTSVEVVTVKIGMSWYVDNLQTETEGLYNFFED